MAFLPGFKYWLDPQCGRMVSGEGSGMDLCKVGPHGSSLADKSVPLKMMALFSWDPENFMRVSFYKTLSSNPTFLLFLPSYYYNSFLFHMLLLQQSTRDRCSEGEPPPETVPCCLDTQHQNVGASLNPPTTHTFTSYHIEVMKTHSSV